MYSDYARSTGRIIRLANDMRDMYEVEFDRSLNKLSKRGL